jgi:hypothetical protein
MKSKVVPEFLGNKPITVFPNLAADNVLSYHETSHVFKCMQCDLQLQTDIAVVRRDGILESEEKMIRIRIDPGTLLPPDGDIEH